MHAYWLIQVPARGVAEAAGVLRDRLGHDAVDIVEGPYDIIARIDVEASEEKIVRALQSPLFIRALPCRVQNRTGSRT